MRLGLYGWEVLLEGGRQILCNRVGPRLGAVHLEQITSLLEKNGKYSSHTIIHATPCLSILLTFYHVVPSMSFEPIETDFDRQNHVISIISRLELPSSQPRKGNSKSLMENIYWIFSMPPRYSEFNFFSSISHAVKPVVGGSR